MNMEEVKVSLISDLEKVTDLKELNDLKVEYLGKKGKITELNQMIKDIPNEEKKEYEEHKEEETLNSMVPLWKKKKEACLSEVRLFSTR